MYRRDFLLVSVAAIAATPAISETVSYAPGLVDRELAAGKTLFLDFKASWCSTCAVQERVIDTLRSSNPDYDRHILFVDIDWDRYRKAPLTRSLAIPRRSTLVVLKGDMELGRVVAATSESVIRDLMDLALSAAIS
ncbi:MAG: thioredoxin family protein [Rhodobacter sp.]|nr:thioredoxin family protein [Rhodobacter sp.]MCY4167513.1 thioredoxin family protein [Rhodobacter sp.]MCY4240913.1 thioredoxin family protein [Rhodobacter sp.]